MTAYREAPIPPPRVILRMKRSILGAFIVGVVMLAVLFAGAIISCGWRLDCERATGVCTLMTWTGIPALGSSRRIALSDIQRAEVSQKIHRHGNLMRARALVVGGRVEIVDRAYTNFDPFGRIDAWAIDVNRFLSDPARQSLSLEDSLQWPLGLAVLIAAIGVGLYFTVRTAVTIDPARRLLRVRRVSWRRGTEWPLGRVRGAEIHVIQGKGSGPMSAVRIALEGDEYVYLTGHSVFDEGKQAMVVAINRELAALSGTASATSVTG